MTDKLERRVYHADCYWLHVYGYQGWKRFNDNSRCVLLEDKGGDKKHPEINIVGCAEDCPDYRYAEGRHFSGY